MDNESELHAFCQELTGASWIALDTEFIREKTYYPQLCLIQLATDSALACIDPLALGDLGPLEPLLLDASVTKVVHAAHQDLEILYLKTGAVPAPVFDTQVAAGLLGYGDQIGYARLVETVLGRSLEKGHARTDWSLRPLEAEQLAYAADDVRYLAEAYPIIVRELERLGRLDWLEEDFRALSDPARYEPDPEGAWQRVKGTQHLKGRQLAVLKHLAAWRERQAMRSDRPRRWILSDDVLLELARRQPTDLRGLGKVRGLEERTFKRLGEELLSLIREGTALPKEQWPVLPERRALAPEQEALVDVAMGILRHRARENEISPAAIASRRDVEAVVCGDRDSDLVHGWRARLAGDAIRGWLAGSLQIRVRDGEMELEK
ncbi:ribonuclease D [Thioalkalivibrio denitrificans]|uniref:Ribonuclease D n=1 Tax=Thioalkalivibrio denitrificans TaxID=108003 RepID=A0A1V3NDS1_9GAMM|nr:ribonuclease D [Thioalkalivibrio denitrificans]